MCHSNAQGKAFHLCNVIAGDGITHNYLNFNFKFCQFFYYSRVIGAQLTFHSKHIESIILQFSGVFFRSHFLAFSLLTCRKILLYVSGRLFLIPECSATNNAHQYWHRNITQCETIEYFIGSSFIYV